MIYFQIAKEELEDTKEVIIPYYLWGPSWL